MKKVVIIFSFLSISMAVFTQHSAELSTYLSKEHKIEKRSMIALTTWGGLNMASGIPGWLSATGEAKYFHQMNTTWGAINTGIGLTALLLRNNSPDTPSQLLNKSHRTEKILYLNTGLDVAYVTAGFLFRSAAKNNPENVHRFRGFGNSLLLQGGFLLLFDITQLAIHTMHRNQHEHIFFENLSLSDHGIGLKYSIN